MNGANQNSAYATETIIYGKPQGGEMVSITRRAPLKILTLKQCRQRGLGEIVLTEKEQQACNMATD